MRPIISQTMSILSPTARFIDHVLQPLAQSSPDYLHNSTTLSCTLQDLTVPDHAILVSIDVESLYPSIPQSQCLNIIYTEICNNPHLFKENVYDTYAQTPHMKPTKHPCSFLHDYTAGTTPQELHRRNYPKMFVNKIVNTVNYNHHKKYLEQKPHKPTCLLPLFKCFPPPHYKLLKQIVLKNYSELHFVSPRFITLRHPTLHNSLVRAQLSSLLILNSLFRPAI